MSANKAQKNSDNRTFRIRDRRIGLGVALTLVWLLSWLGIAWHNGWDQFWRRDLERMGGFEGLFAPLAFLWLVIGLFIQQKELAKNSREFQRSNLQAAEQNRVLKATELRARQATFFDIANQAYRGAGTLLEYMVSTTLGPTGKAVFTDEDLTSHWAAHGAGEYERFPFLIVANELATRELFFGNDTNRLWSEDLVRNVRSLFKLAYECDDSDRTISRSITQNSLVDVYSSILGYMEEPSTRAMFDEQSIFDVVHETVDVRGKWKTIASPNSEYEEFAMEIGFSKDKQMTGLLTSTVGSTEIEYGAVKGDRLFIRFLMMDQPCILTGLVTGDQMTAEVQWRLGVLKRLVVMRT